jgi:general secretion pathway protein O
VVLLAAISGLLFAFVQRGGAKKDLNQPLAFGPWLALAGVANMLLFQGI